MALLSAETNHLLHKRRQQGQRPLQILASAIAATVAFSQVYLCLAFGLRYSNWALAVLLGPCLLLLLCLCLAFYTFRRYRWARPVKGWISLLICAAVGMVVGCRVANSVWWAYTVNYYSHQDLASYVNVDPGMDSGQSFMDAGTVYFKESSYVLTKKALAFRNGATYCVAPIVRQPVQLTPGQPANSFQLQTVTGFVAPRSGTIDFWAVGTDCCGETGTDEPFTCGEAKSSLARSGLRLLNSNDRAMYLLATQEWSASTGLNVRHPVFFSWVKDPIQTLETDYNMAWRKFWMSFIFVFVGTLLLALIIHMLLSTFRIQ
mmetsp:Transcript_60745/g.131710  ORF Transcript_60745/g.131710 Transcript_60745/m.131710 type:complete len:318 (-) Transcript_60745:110-1063(-)